MAKSRFSLVAPCFTTVALVAACDPASTDSWLTEDKPQSVLQVANLVGAPYVDGKLGMRIADNFDGGSETYYTVDTEDFGFVLRDFQVPEGMELGSRIRVHGELSSEDIKVDRLEFLAPPAEPIIDPDPFTPRSLATVLVNFNDIPEDDMTRDQMTANMYEGPYSMNAFYIENSYGKESVGGDLFGWYQLNMNGAGGCDTNGIASAARSAAAADGADVNAYSQWMYYMADGTGCAWGGLAQVGQPRDPARDTWYNGWAVCVVLVQEIGHNYGMQHSKQAECGDSAAMCSNYSSGALEYGNPITPIGYGPCGHLDVHHKGYMGYFEQCNTVTTGTTGQYILAATELPCNGIQDLMIPRSGGSYYHLEYRTPRGFDGPESPGALDSHRPDLTWPDGLQGVFMYVAPGYGSGGTSYLVDNTPGSGPANSQYYSADHLDGQLNEGDTFNYAADGITVEVIEENDTYAVVEVTVSGGGAAPTCLDSSTPPQSNGVWGSTECEGGGGDTGDTGDDSTDTDTGDDGTGTDTGDGDPTDTDTGDGDPTDTDDGDPTDTGDDDPTGTDGDDTGTGDGDDTSTDDVGDDSGSDGTDTDTGTNPTGTTTMTTTMTTTTMTTTGPTTTVGGETDPTNCQCSAGSGPRPLATAGLWLGLLGLSVGRRRRRRS